MLLFDGHLDLSMNAVEWNRDITRPLEEVRRREAGMKDKKDRGNGVLTLPEMRKGQIGLCIATQIARYVAPENPLPGWHSPAIAWSITQAQLAWYRAMEEAGEMRQIVDAAGLREHVKLWSEPAAAGKEDTRPIGYVLSLEGADSLITLHHLERAYSYGLRALGPAHYGPGRYAPGTGSSGGFAALGRELLAEMKRLGMILDATHLTDEGFWEALERFDGPVWASHSNCRALVPDQRQFDDDQIRALIERGAVIGAAYDAWMMWPNWIRGVTRPENTTVTIATAVDHIDHICQIAGSASFCAIGSDLDGGYGREQTPKDLESIAQLQSLTEILANRGYSQSDIEGIMHGNWVRFMERAWK